MVTTSQGQIIIIGPRASGKSTFLVALASLAEKKMSWPIKKVEPLSGNSHRLIESANNTLRQGLLLCPTDISLTEYSFRVDIGSYSLIDQKTQSFYLNCADSAGEYFDGLVEFRDEERTQKFLLECSISSGLVIIVDGLSPSSKDNYYRERIEIFRQELSNHTYENYRIAIVISKADQPKIWNSLKDLKGFFRKAFPLTYELLEDWNSQSEFAIEYFACSAYGMVGNSFNPNCHEAGGIKVPNAWNPFGIVYPLYWIATGKINQNLQFAEVPKSSIFIDKKTIMSIGIFSLIILSALALLGLSSQLQNNNSTTGDACNQTWSDEEEQLKTVQEKMVNNSDNVNQNCQKKLDQLLFSTGINQAKKGLVPVAIDRFCRISASSTEELVGSNAFISRWQADENWQTMVNKQLQITPNCPAAK
ncbi:GTPase domain-containing protein [Synechocystis sp. PCC 7338]|uniref:TRAFAC clade GTPase domain-containing protein n=1 Tax=Synechocystis sp. PCC 7338 TaxID=2732530 RepID=UPI001BAE85B8|nr:GTPase domain-containing protein [Synechocystis sp. PCC 7338]QUS60499.1 GTPase domain-containing protein [Synechocystis sp. PCC 7338]